MSMNARKKKTNEFELYDVLYEDGTRSSNRKVPLSKIDTTDADRSAKAFILAQDRKIAEASGNPRGPIKSVARVKR
ncbi:MAG: hypothetical protein O9277_11370 [Magnetospirillum sp.]|nr:hypothetical protein [Magnetospirillum sp.]